MSGGRRASSLGPTETYLLRQWARQINEAFGCMPYLVGSPRYVVLAWEPVLIKAARKPIVDKSMTYRDWVSEPIALQRGLVGAKPEAVCRWAFNVAGCQSGDELVDLFPGTGAVTRAWQSWCAARPLNFEGVS